ncbi:MAG TPA: HlyD family efflux transporter periplasmic adaptor subunit [Thermoanaerobaculia bacterium]|nr:HlyD family efflux transporter periplasmic adaptor subunit [Thermoanaerobaculia bacterium]
MSSAFASRKLLAAGRPEETAKLLASRRGASDDRPALRRDLSVLRQVQMGEVLWIVKNPTTLKYFQFKNAQWQLIRLFDGRRTRAEIVAEFNRRAGDNPIPLERVLEYEEFLRERELIEQSVAERSLTLLDKYQNLRHKKAEEKSEGFNPFFIMFHVMDPDRFLARTVKYVSWIWTPPIAFLTLAASIWTAFIFSRHWGPLWSGTMDLYHFLGKPLLDIIQFFFILSIIGAIHEFAHAYSLKKYGGECHDIGLALFYFTPAFYCDTTDSILFKNKYKRLWVTIAGIYSEVAICSVATAFWVASYPDTLLNQLAYKTMLFTGISAVFFNINPLIKVDGYYALTSLLQMPELREAAWQRVGAWFQKSVLRLPVEVPATTPRKRRIYWIYGLLSIAYTATIMFFVYSLFRNFYYKYFPTYGVVFLIVTLAQIFRKKARTAIRVGKLFYLDKRELLMSSRSHKPLAIAAAVLVLILAVPWTRRTIQADGVLRPVSRVALQAPEDSVVAQVLVGEGDRVEKGQPIARLVSPAADEQIKRLATEEDRFEKESSRNRAMANAAMTFQAERRAKSAELGLQSARSRQGFLLLRSPISGRILTHRPQDLTGRFVVEGTELVEVGDCRRMAVDVGVSERLLRYLHVGESASALVRTDPLNAREGRVASISAMSAGAPVTTADQAPPAPSEVPDRFLAIAVFENADGKLLPGASARVKLHSRRAPYGARIGTMLWNWVRANVW